MEAIPFFHFVFLPIPLLIFHLRQILKSTPIFLLKKEYGIDIKDPREGRKVLVDVATMAGYIQEHGKK